MPNAKAKPTHPIVDEPRERRLPTTYFVDTDQGRQTQIAQNLEVRPDGTLTFNDDEGDLVAGYHRDHWLRFQSERQSQLTPSGT